MNDGVTVSRHGKSLVVHAGEDGFPIFQLVSSPLSLSLLAFLLPFSETMRKEKGEKVVGQRKREESAKKERSFFFPGTIWVLSFLCPIGYLRVQPY